MTSRTLQRSFAAGEITPEAYGRLDLVRFQTGLAIARNFETRPHGPARNRAGFGYVLEVKDSSKRTSLLDFTYNADQSNILEFGEGYIRFHTQGATVLEAAKNITGVTQANPGVVSITAHGYSNGQWVYLAGIGGMTQLNSRFAKVAGITANTFQLQNLDGTNLDTTSYGAYTSGGTAARVYEIASPYAEADLSSLDFTQSGDVLTITHANYATRELKRLGSANWTLTTVPFAPVLTPPVAATVKDKQATSPTNLKVYRYKVTALHDPTLEESEASVDGLQGGALVKAITRASPGVITTREAHGFSVNDRVYVSGVGGMVELTDGYYLVNSVPSSKSLSLKTLAGAAINTSSYSAYSSGGSVTSAVNAVTNANPGVLTTARAHKLEIDDYVYVKDVGMPSIPDGYYYVGSVPSTTTLSLLREDQSVVDTTSDGAWPALGGVVSLVGAKNNLSQADTYNTITWKPVSGALRYNVYRELNGVYGYVGQAAGTSFTDDNIVPDISKSPPINRNLFVGAGNYPRGVGYHSGRRWFCGPVNKPRGVYATRSGTEAGMTYSVPTRDDDSLDFSLGVRRGETVRHIVPLDDLHLFTSGSVWQVATENSDAITPSTVAPKSRGNVGASEVQPITTSESILFAQAVGGRIFEYRYFWEANGFKPVDLSVVAPHLFDGYTITDLAMVTAPDQVAWATRSDGVLLGLTYIPEQQVSGWHHHDTQGEFESIAVAREGDEDALYAVVKRFINGRDVRYIERKRSRRFTSLADCFFVDAGSTYSGAPATVITNLHHLEGEEVVVLADGAVVRGLVVTNGSITLPYAASKVHIGLSYLADLQTLPLAMETAAFGQGMLKNLDKVYLRVLESSGILAGPSFDDLKPLKQRTSEPYGTPPAVISGMFEMNLLPTWGLEGQFCLRQEDPLPLTVSTLVLEVADGG